MHDYKYDNSFFLGPEKIHQNSQTRSHFHYKAYLRNQEGISNRNASVFESDKSQDDNDLSFQPSDPIQASNGPETCHPTKTIAENTQQTQNHATSTKEFSLELPHTIPDNREPTTIDAQDELMQWHYSLNHLSFKCLFQLAKQGLATH